MRDTGTAAGKSNPLVSVCMAACLRPDLFPESLDAALRQTYDPLEIIVLADGSDPAALALLGSRRDARLRWIATPRPSGMIGAWNRVCREARGKYLLFCADDDVLCERAVDHQTELLEEHPGVAFCHADFIYIDDDGRELGRWISHRGRFIEPRAKAWPRYLTATRCCMQTTVVRRELWEAVGGWDPDAGNPGDNSLYLKLLRLGDEGHVPHVACKYRIRTRQPDSWEKRLRNLREYHALAMKHLASIPPEVRQPRLRERLMVRLARMAVPLSISAPDERSRQELGFIWPQSALGRFCARLDRAGALGLMELAMRAEAGIRRAARAPLLAARRI